MGGSPLPQGPGFSAPMPSPVESGPVLGGPAVGRPMPGGPLPGGPRSGGPVARVYPPFQGQSMIQTAGYRPMYYPPPYNPYPGYWPMEPVNAGYGYGAMNAYAR
jgi:hypothetical protein